ncbi:MAG: hypothetical protein II933_00350 [Candidatus Methanomethylophilaceae archaeon]|nr:hypothetical protein [Candidatus Methanomethylophilaceae archaeon]
MSLFAKKVTVFGPETVSVGDFDPTVDGCYRNVVTIPLDVKPRRNLYVSLKSDNPVDIVVANDDRSAAGHKENQTELVFGPFPTKSMDSMGIILGIYRGEKAQVTLEVWIDKRWNSS